MRFQTWPAVKIGVEAQDRLNSLVFRHGDVDGVPGGKRKSILHDLSGALHVALFHREHVVNDIQEYLKRRPDGISPVDGRIAIKDFLQPLRIGDQSLSDRSQPFHPYLPPHLASMSAPTPSHR